MLALIYKRSVICAAEQNHDNNNLFAFILGSNV
jgi:hypothetical protein